MPYYNRNNNNQIVPVSKAVNYLKNKLPGKGAKDFRNLTKFMMEKTNLTQDKYKIYNDLGNGYMGLLIRNTREYKPGHGNVGAYVLLFKGEPLELVGDEQFEPWDDAGARSTWSISNNFTKDKDYEWATDPLDVLPEVREKRDQEYKEWNDEREAQRERDRLEQERKDKEAQAEKERKQKEVHKRGNVEYNILSTSSHGDRSSIYGSDSIEIRVVNDASEEEVRKEFDDPLAEFHNRGNGIYDITYYRD